MAKDYVLNDSIPWRRKCALETLTPLEYSRAKHLAFQRAHAEAAAEDWRHARGSMSDPMDQPVWELARENFEAASRAAGLPLDVREDTLEEGVTGVRARKVAP